MKANTWWTIKWFRDQGQHQAQVFAHAKTTAGDFQYVNTYAFNKSIVSGFVAQYLQNNIAIHATDGSITDLSKIPPTWSAERLIEESDCLWKLQDKNGERIPELHFQATMDRSVTIDNLNRGLRYYADIFYNNVLVKQFPIDEQFAHFIMKDKKAYRQAMTALQCAFLISDWYSGVMANRIEFAFQIGVMNRAEQTFDWDYSGSVERILRVVNYEIPLEIMSFVRFCQKSVVDLTEQIDSLCDPRAGFPKKKLRRIV